MHFAIGLSPFNWFATRLPNYTPIFPARPKSVMTYGLDKSAPSVHYLIQTGRKQFSGAYEFFRPFLDELPEFGSSLNEVLR